MAIVRSTDGAARNHTAVPLSRNRHYHILWSSQLLSEIAIEIAAVAFPLLILARSGSALEMGLASSVAAAAGMAAVLPAGVLADRWNRRRLMLVCQAGRAAAAASLVIALAAGWYSVWHVVAVMMLDGVLAAVFDPAEHAALPQVVADHQLSAAVSRNMARPFVAALLGPAVAGALFAVAPVGPFVANLAMLGIAVVALMFLRLPRPAPRVDELDGDGPLSYRADLLGGLRWVLGHRIIRNTLLWVVVTNLVFTALVVIILARSYADDVGAGRVGLMMTCLGLGGLLGAVVASRLHETLPPQVSILGFAWTAAVTTALMAVVPAGVWLGVLLGVAALLAPAANTTVLTYQLIITPDELRGRLSSVAGFCSGGAGALGPALGGLLMSIGGGANALWWCAGALTVVALAVTISPTFRSFPASGAQ